MWKWNTGVTIVAVWYTKEKVKTKAPFPSSAITKSRLLLQYAPYAILKKENTTKDTVAYQQIRKIVN